MIENIGIDRELYKHLIRQTEKGESLDEMLKKEFAFDGELET